MHINWIGWGLLGALAVVFVAPHMYVALVIHFRKPTEIRVSFPADRRLTEQDAIELTRKALVLDGKYADTMHPVARKDSEGREVIFLKRREDVDEGGVLWWLERPDDLWEYSVGISRDCDDVVCKIWKPF
jgi:hypothetical protein